MHVDQHWIDGAKHKHNSSANDQEGTELALIIFAIIH